MLTWRDWLHFLEEAVGFLLLLALWRTEIQLIKRLEIMDKKAEEQSRNMLGAFGANMGLNTLIALAQSFGLKLAYDEMKPKQPTGPQRVP